MKLNATISIFFNKYKDSEPNNKSFCEKANICIRRALGNLRLELNLISDVRIEQIKFPHSIRGNMYSFLIKSCLE